MWPRVFWYKLNFHLCHTTRSHIPEVYLFYYRYLLSFLLWTLLPTHCSCKGYFCTLPHPMTHTHTHTHSVGLLSTRNRTVAETCACATPAFTTDRLPCFRWDSNSQSQQASGRRPSPQTARPPELAVKVFSKWNPGYKFKITRAWFEVKV